LRMGTAATTFQTGLERRLPVPVRRARMKGLQAPLQVCSALHSPAGSDRRGFPLPCRARLARQNEYGRQRSPTLPSRITTSPRRSTAGLFFCGSPRPAGAPGGRAGYIARCGALEEDEHAVGGSQLPLLANTLLLPRRETGGVFRKMLGD
jgi:hypothetical protein